MAYVDYAKSEGMSKVVVNALTSAIQLHPLEPILYILLSQHYLDPLPPSHKRQTAASSSQHSSPGFSIENIPPARKTLLLGLRFLPNNIDLWIEYVKLELGWVEALRRRWNVLGILDQVMSQDHSDKTIDAAQVEGGQDFTLDPTDNSQRNGDEDEMETVDEGAGAFGSTGEDARKQLINGDLVLTILQSSFKRDGLQNNLDYYLRLLDLLRQYPTGLRMLLLDHVYEAMETGPYRLRQNTTARRVWIERALFDAPYDPEEDERLSSIQPHHYLPTVKGEGSRVVLSGKDLVMAVADIVKRLQAEQDIEGLIEVERGEVGARLWRKQWHAEVVAWLGRWAERLSENQDLVSFLQDAMIKSARLTFGTSLPVDSVNTCWLLVKRCKKHDTALSALFDHQTVSSYCLFLFLSYSCT